MHIKATILDVFLGVSKNDGKSFAIITFRPLSEGARDLKVFVGSDVDTSKISVGIKAEFGFVLVPDKDQRPTVRVVSVSPLA